MERVRLTRPCCLDAVAVPLGANPAFRTTAAVRFYKVAPQLDPDAPTAVRRGPGPLATDSPTRFQPPLHSTPIQKAPLTTHGRPTAYTTAPRAYLSFVPR